MIYENTYNQKNETKKVLIKLIQTPFETISSHVYKGKWQEQFVTNMVTGSSKVTKICETKFLWFSFFISVSN